MNPVPPHMQWPNFSVSFSVSCPPKLSVSITINHLVHFGMITVNTHSLEIFVRSHYPIWMIHNFSSETFFPFMISNENNFQWDLLQPPQVHYCRKCKCICEPDQIYIYNCGALKYLTEWKEAIKSLLLTWGFPHLFDNYKNVWIYRDGQMKFVEKS